MKVITLTDQGGYFVSRFHVPDSNRVIKTARYHLISQTVELDRDYLCVVTLRGDYCDYT